MSRRILGIDLGTSSVKLLLWSSNGQIEKSRASYSEKTPNGWMNAIKEAVKGLDISGIDAIGVSSQVGTYIINGRDVISWDNGVGKEELDYIKNRFSAEKFIEEIAMPHPDILSYPIPRLMYIKKHYKNIESICQPKDYILKALIGNCVTDQYSFRGLAHTTKGVYSDFFLKEIGITEDVLPPVVSPDTMVGLTTSQCANTFGIPEGIPVFTGLNDFFSSVVGMGVKNSGDMFDITGTSEHLGLVCDALNRDTKMISGVYFEKYIHYGVTASSGASLDFGIKNFGFDDININECLNNRPPIFTPYLNGERAPIFDNNAKGTFFGISAHCTKRDMAYSILEGVVFSLYHIYESMETPPIGSLTVSGGASKNMVLNSLKAELFQTKVYTLKENDTSALGAVKIAAKALGISDSEHFNAISDVVVPCGKYRELLLKRYNIYKNIYASLKEQFIKFSNI
ncbi:MAG: hypothetical protein IJB80_02570 [Clostridia bacterium]|nr:hypothetical protein [Clostridia bacterium]